MKFWQFKHTLFTVFLLVFLVFLLMKENNDIQEAENRIDKINTINNKSAKPSVLQHKETTQNKSFDSYSSSKRNETSETPQDVISPEIDVSEYYQLSGEAIYHKLAMLRAGASPSASDILLALIDSGILSPTTPVKIDHNGFEYSTLFTALVIEPNISAEKVAAFLEYGSDIGSEELWLNVLTNTTNAEVTQLLLEHASFGPEHNEQLLQNALISGNENLYDYMMKSGEVVLTAEFTSQLTQQTMSMTNEAITHFDQIFTDIDGYDLNTIDDDRKWLSDNLFRLNTLANNPFIDTSEKKEILQKRARVQELLLALEQYSPK